MQNNKTYTVKECLVKTLLNTTAIYPLDDGMSLKVSRLDDHFIVTLSSRTEYGITRYYAFNRDWPGYKNDDQIDSIVRHIALDIMDIREKEHIVYHNRIVSADEFIHVDENFLKSIPKVTTHCGNVHLET